MKNSNSTAEIFQMFQKMITGEILILWEKGYLQATYSPRGIFQSFEYNKPFKK